MQHADPAGDEVAPAAERIEQPAEVVAPKGGSHGVDREVAAVQVVPDGRVLDGRQRRRRVVELGAGGDDVDALPVAVEHDGGAELLVGAYASVELLRDPPRQRDCVALDRDVDVEAVLAEQDVADRAPDEVDAVDGLAHGCDRVEDRCEPLQAAELAGDGLGGFGRRLLRLAQRLEDVAPRDHAGEPFAVQHRDPALRRGGQQPLQLGQARLLVHRRDTP